MKRILFMALISLLALSATAQTHVEIKGSRVFQEGNKLTKEQAVSLFSDVNGHDFSGDYIRYRKSYKAGLGMTIGGASMALAGSVVLAAGSAAAMIVGVPYAMFGKDMPSDVAALAGIGFGMTIGGIAVMAAGIPTLCVYKNRLNKMETVFGPQSGGIGLALRF